MQLSKRYFILAVCIVTVFVSCAVYAQYTPRIEVGVSQTKGQVIINGKIALSFLASNGNLSPSGRAKITAERIAAFIDSGLPAIYIYAKGDNKSAKIVADTTVLCVVTPTDAKKNKSTPLDLAKAWAKNIRVLLLMPPVTLSQKDITVPVGETRKVSVGGSADGPISVNVADSKVISAAASNQDREVIVQGIQPGYTFADISVNGEIVTLRVSVKKYAGAIVQPRIETIVTGEPCPEGVLEAAFERAVMRTVICEPGAKAQIVGRDGLSSELEAGKSRAATARVKITGPDYITYNSTVSVGIKNEMLGYTKPDVLFYSNNPERVTEPQVLFAGKTSPDKETRLLYHHQNDAGKKLRLTIEVVNFNLTPVVFRLFPGSASINRDTVVVGYSAGKSFLSNYSRNVSLVDPIPGQMKLTLVSQIIQHGETASGILELSQMQGDEAYVIVRVSDPSASDACVGTLAKAPDQALWKISSHVYPTPSKALDETFEVGKQWKFISVGKNAIQSSDSQRKLDGNYGVSYHINLKVKNPQPEKGKVSILFDATAGFASVVSLINGRIVGEKYVKPPHEAHLVSYTLEPGEEKDVKIVFIPLAGSNYPAKLVVKG